MSSEDRTGQDWNKKEVDLIVADYFDMRDMELRGERYVKSQRNAALQSLTGRSRGSIEFKHQNISAVLMKLGEPWISGYKPMMNFQTALIEGVERFIESQTGRVIPFPVQKKGVADAAQLFLEQAPDMTQGEVEDDASIKRLIRKFDPAARDARNRELGKLGEARVLASEQTRLTSDGRADLADKIRWVSELDGDGAGYDILSFEKDGSERYLEVKTTVGYSRTGSGSSGSMTLPKRQRHSLSNLRLNIASYSNQRTIRLRLDEKRFAWSTNQSAGSSTTHPLPANLAEENFCLRQNRLHGLIRQIRGIPIFLQDALHKNTHSGARTFLSVPINSGIRTQILQKLMCNHTEPFITHRLNGALILGKGIIEGDLFRAEAQIQSA